MRILKKKVIIRLFNFILYASKLIIQYKTHTHTQNECFSKYSSFNVVYKTCQNLSNMKLSDAFMDTFLNLKAQNWQSLLLTCNE